MLTARRMRERQEAADRASREATQAAAVQAIVQPAPEATEQAPAPAEATQAAAFESVEDAKAKGPKPKAR